MITYQTFISQSTANYLKQQYPAHTPKWMSEFDGEVERIVKKWRLAPSGHEKTSRFGTIIYAYSEIYGSVAVKIVPWFSPRLNSEVYCYKTLPYREMCELFDVDDALGAMLLKYAPQDHASPRSTKEALFTSLYEQRKAAAGQFSLLPAYEDVLRDVLKNARAEAARDADFGEYIQSINRAEAAMDYFANSERYIIHGDAHEYNILADGETCVLIDPLGYVAPFAFEYARYLGTVIKETHPADAEVYALLWRLLPKGTAWAEALLALAIDVTLRACNTFIEGNTRAEIIEGARWALSAWAHADALKRA